VIRILEDTASRRVAVTQHGSRTTVHINDTPKDDRAWERVRLFERGDVRDILIRRLADRGIHL